MKNMVSFGTIRFVKFVRFVVTSFLGQTRIAHTLFLSVFFFRVNPWLILFILSERGLFLKVLRRQTNFETLVTQLEC